MKMMKSLLLGSAAGVVAVAGAQAADLPVKAKPVEYVKVCSLYGAGYYYIPGTDVCMRIGGYVRQEWSYGYGDNMTNGPFVSTSMLNTRINGARDLVWRTRAYLTQETRQQTAYGTLRTYLNIGLNGNNSTDFSANRAFIQIAGFTVGLASSYFDHYSVAAIAYLVDQSSDTGDGGRRVFAYTAQLGNGVSASISAEMPEDKRAGVWNTAVGSAAAVFNADGTFKSTAFTFGPALGIAGTAQAIQDQEKANIPDIVANLRVDQAWGSAQIMGVLKDVSAGYYSSTTGSLTGATIRGYPDDKWGWAVGAGLKINLPMIARGDYFAVQAAYGEGATRYISNTTWNSSQAYFNGGGEIGFGWASDAVFCGAGSGLGTNACDSTTSIQLTTAWGVAGGWEHFWTPSLRTSVHGSYVAIRYNETANRLLCDAMDYGSNAAGTIRSINGEGPCNNNWSMWQVGSRTQWNVTKDFYMGFDVVYYHLNTALEGQNVTVNATGAQPSADRRVEDQDVVAVRVRWHRDIVP